MWLIRALIGVPLCAHSKQCFFHLGLGSSEAAFLPLPFGLLLVGGVPFSPTQNHSPCGALNTHHGGKDAALVP